MSQKIAVHLHVTVIWNLLAFPIGGTSVVGDCHQNSQIYRRVLLLALLLGYLYYDQVVLARSTAIRKDFLAVYVRNDEKSWPESEEE